MSITTEDHGLTSAMDGEGTLLRMQWSHASCPDCRVGVNANLEKALLRHPDFFVSDDGGGFSAVLVSSASDNDHSFVFATDVKVDCGRGDLSLDGAKRAF